MSTAAEQEAERLYPTDGMHPESPDYIRALDDRVTFISGAEWALAPYRELLEAAREYRDADRAQDEMRFTAAWMSLRAAAAALNEE